MFGLPDEVSACLFNMDGVVTQAAVVPAAASNEVQDLAELLDKDVR